MKLSALFLTACGAPATADIRSRWHDGMLATLEITRGLWPEADVLSEAAQRPWSATLDNAGIASSPLLAVICSTAM
jgi:hypothetical protein